MGKKLAKEIRKQQKIFYHPHVSVKNVGSCNFLCLFPCSLTHLMFPCSLLFFCFVPVFPLPNFPCSLVPQNPRGSLMIGAQDVSACKRKHAQTRVSWQNFSFLLPRHRELQSSSCKLFLPNSRRRVSFYTLVGQPLSKQLHAFGTGLKSSDFCFPACHFPFQ